MNAQSGINKLLYALSQKGQRYKINSFKFYSEKINNYCTKYQVLKEESVEIYNDEEDNYETQMQYKVKEEFYNKFKLLEYLMGEYRKM